MSTYSAPLVEYLDDEFQLGDEREELMTELDAYGITTVEQFEDAYQGTYTSGAQFSEQTCFDIGYLESPNVPDFIINHIDWQAVWDCELRHDYFDIGCMYFSKYF